MRANPERLHSGALLGGGSISQGLWRKQLSLGLACFRRVIETMTATCSPTPSSSSAGSLHDTMRRRPPDFGPWPSGPSDEVTLETALAAFAKSCRDHLKQVRGQASSNCDRPPRASSCGPTGVFIVLAAGATI